MGNEQFTKFIDLCQEAFTIATTSMLDTTFQKCSGCSPKAGELVSVIIGMIGQKKGRVIITMSGDTSKKVAETINGEPPEDQYELFYCLCEFSNIFSGKAVTMINNEYRGVDLRLTPPAIFEGEDIEINTPAIQNEILEYQSDLGTITIDVGFEGMV